MTTYMITLHNNDSNIINRDDVIVQLCTHMASEIDITINLNNEGPCAASLGLYDLLDRLCHDFDYDKSRISIRTCNLKEYHPVYKIDIQPQLMYLESARSISKQITVRHKDFGARFKHFAHFIGHGNVHRLHIASQLHKKFASKSLCSYHYKMDDNYHRIFVGLEDMMFLGYDNDEIQIALDFLKQCPILLDDISQYPILNPATFNLAGLYHKFFVEIVSMTYFSGNSFYIDEKIWRPMMMRTPFMVQGPRNFLLGLQSLGFLTFDRWWDEGYSEDSDRVQIEGILKNLAKLSTLTVDALQKMYDEMKTTLDHNAELMQSIGKENFLLACKS